MFTVAVGELEVEQLLSGGVNNSSKECGSTMWKHSVEAVVTGPCDAKVRKRKV